MILISEFIKLYMRRGKKLKAYNAFMNILSMLKMKLKLLKVTLRRFMQIIALNSFPLLYFVTRSVGSRKYKIPVPIVWKKSAHLAALWIFESLIKRAEKNFHLKLIGELLDIYDKKGNTIKLKKAHHITAFENKSFVRFLKKRTKKNILKLFTVSKYKLYRKKRLNRLKPFRRKNILKYNIKLLKQKYKFVERYKWNKNKIKKGNNLKKKSVFFFKKNHISKNVNRNKNNYGSKWN